MPGTATGGPPALKGFAHAHVTWLFRTKGMERGEHYGRDVYADPVLRVVDRLYFLWVTLTFALPFAVGYLVGGLSLAAGAQALVWAGLIRVFAYQHATFSVNSICHMFGRRAYRSRDESRNNWLVAALTFGEGWHNNHHAFPSSARHGLDAAPARPRLVDDPRARAPRARVGREGARRRSPPAAASRRLVALAAFTHAHGAERRGTCMPSGKSCPCFV